jgi:hypothetical protein
MRKERMKSVLSMPVVPKQIIVFETELFLDCFQRSWRTSWCLWRSRWPDWLQWLTSSECRKGMALGKESK